MLADVLTKEMRLSQALENVLLNNMIEFEKQKQFDSFSQIYFNKVKINSQIYEF